MCERPAAINWRQHATYNVHDMVIGDIGEREHVLVFLMYT